MSKLIGSLVYWNDVKKYGFIESKIPAPSGGYFLRRYYLHRSRIDYVESEVKVGCWCLFRKNEEKPRFETDAPYAREVEIFDTEQLALVVNEAKVAAPNPDETQATGIDTLLGGRS